MIHDGDAFPFHFEVNTLTSTVRSASNWTFISLEILMKVYFKQMLLELVKPFMKKIFSVSYNEPIFCDLIVLLLGMGPSFPSFQNIQHPGCREVDLMDIRN